MSRPPSRAGGHGWQCGGGGEAPVPPPGLCGALAGTPPALSDASQRGAGLTLPGSPWPLPAPELNRPPRSAVEAGGGSNVPALGSLEEAPLETRSCGGDPPAASGRVCVPAPGWKGSCLGSAARCFRRHPVEPRQSPSRGSDRGSEPARAGRDRVRERTPRAWRPRRSSAHTPPRVQARSWRNHPDQARRLAALVAAAGGPAGAPGKGWTAPLPDQKTPPPRPSQQDPHCTPSLRTLQRLHFA